MLTKTEIHRLNKEQALNFIKENEDQLPFIASENLTLADIKTCLLQHFHELSEDEREDAVNKMPEIGDENWTPYLLSLLYDNEIVDGRPTVAGLRRLFDCFVGEIIDSTVTSIQSPHVNNQNMATVQYQITYLPYGQFDYTKTRTISEIADCYFGNTKVPFVKFPSSTAATMAEGRCLRKALRMNIVSLEESQTPEGEDADFASEQEKASMLATDNMKNTIHRISDRLNIDLQKLLEHTNDVDAATIDSLNQYEAQILIKALNKYRRDPADGGEVIPEAILCP